MAFLKKLGLVAALLFYINVWAGEEPPEINPNHPDKYTVVKGDTLWDIAAKFLKNPWEWSKIWHDNPQIKNPHWIYPGNVLVFSMVDGQPVVTIRDYRDVKLYPRIRSESIEDAIKVIPTDAIAQFLNTPKVVNEEEIDDSPYVLEFPDEHVMVGAGDRLYVRSILEPKSLNYTIYRKGQAYRDAKTNELLGYEAMYVASAKLDKEGEVATLTITKSNREILIGDRVMENPKGEFALNFFPAPPNEEINASIISVLDGVSQIGKYNIVVIDKGQLDNIKIGHVFDVYQRGRVIVDKVRKNDGRNRIRLPDEVAGTLMVFRTFKRVSYALVMNATRAIHLLDKVKIAE